MSICKALKCGRSSIPQQALCYASVICISDKEQVTLILLPGSTKEQISTGIPCTYSSEIAWYQYPQTQCSTTEIVCTTPAMAGFSKPLAGLQNQIELMLIYTSEFEALQCCNDGNAAQPNFHKAGTELTCDTNSVRHLAISSDFSKCIQCPQFSSIVNLQQENLHISICSARMMHQDHVKSSKVAMLGP